MRAALKESINIFLIPGTVRLKIFYLFIGKRGEQGMVGPSGPMGSPGSEGSQGKRGEVSRTEYLQICYGKIPNRGVIHLGFIETLQFHSEILCMIF